ncbi:MAG: cytochrome c family protein [Desulfobacteraceae bacterium]|nr:MAG: cytochrome c family protein [Desulfobacteraceae bacterium]
MFRKTLIGLTALLFVMVSVSFSFAADASGGPGGNDRKGKYTYRKVYKACAGRGEVSSPKPVVSPADKTMAEWKTIFESRNFEAFGCLEEWGNLSDKDILDIYTYFYNHGSDSPSPAQCQ